MKRILPAGLLILGLLVLGVSAAWVCFCGRHSGAVASASIGAADQATELAREQVLRASSATNSSLDPSEGFAARCAVPNTLGPVGSTPLLPVPQPDVAWQRLEDRGATEGAGTLVVDEQCRPVAVVKAPAAAGNAENQGEPTLAPPELQDIDGKKEVLIIQVHAEQSAESKADGRR